MLPLSLREFLSMTGLEPEQGFSEYLRNGGMPYIAAMNRSNEKVNTYLEGIYNTVIVKDIEDRQARKESDPSKRKITDIALLKTIAKISCKCCRESCICQKYYGLSDFKWKKDITKYRRGIMWKP